MKKFTIAALVGLLMVAFAISIVSAAPDTNNTTPQFRNQITLTDEQKQELAPLYKQMFETKKQILQKYVGYGYITQEQAQQRIDRMETCIKGGNYGPGIGQHFGNRPEQGGRGFRHHQQCPQQPQQPQQ